jgi:hypothetical protein
LYFLLGRMMTPVLDPVSNDLAVVLVFLAPIVSKVFKGGACVYAFPVPGVIIRFRFGGTHPLG